MLSLSKIYSNKESIFPTIHFRNGLNVVFASVTKGLSDKDSHSLGKTTFIELIDYMLIKAVKKTFFLKKRKEFRDFNFYLEIISTDNLYITIKREVEGKISLHTAKESDDLRKTDTQDFEFPNLGVTSAKNKLNELLFLGKVKDLGFHFRSGLRYCMRKQSQYENIFKVNSSRERDLNWKPYLSGLLGISAKLVAEKYEVNARADNISNAIKELKDIPKQSTQGLEAELTQLRQSLERKQGELDEFNFKKADQEINTSLAYDISKSITNKNKDLYSVIHKIQAIDNSLKSDFNFNIEKVQELFNEVQLYFQEYLVKSYDELINLNKQMTTGRKNRLKKTKKQLNSEKNKIQDQLSELNKTQQNLSSMLIDKSMFEKYKILQSKLSAEEARLAVLEERLQQADTASSLKKTLIEIEQTKTELTQKLDLQTRVRENELLKKAFGIFSEYVEEVLNLSIFFFIETNKDGNPEFKINLKDQSSVTDGFSYTRVIAAIFDLMLLSLYHDSHFYRFAYHDGLLETLDDRVKERLIILWREISQKFGFQLILSVLDSDLPLDENGEKKYFEQHEIIRELHDRGDDGRLFKMKAF